MFRNIILLISFCVMALSASEFQLDLHLNNAQVEKVILGCANGATNGYDHGKDIVVPPMGMGTAVVGFLLEGSDNQLYSDIRPTALPVTWKLRCKLPQMPALPNMPRAPKVLVVSWDPKQIPDDIQLTFNFPGGKAYDMRKITFTHVKNNGEITFTATTKTAQPTQTAPQDK